MRIKNELVSFLKQSIKNYLPEADVYLIGSRADDRQKGGDIDILVIGENQLTGQEKRNITGLHEDMIYSHYRSYHEIKKKKNKRI